MRRLRQYRSGSVLSYVRSRRIAHEMLALVVSSSTVFSASAGREQARRARTEPNQVRRLVPSDLWLL